MKMVYLILIIILFVSATIIYLLLPILYSWGVLLEINGRLNFADVTNSRCSDGEINFFVTNDGGGDIDLNKLKIYESLTYKGDYQIIDYIVNKSVIKRWENATITMPYCSDQNSRCYVKIETERNVINNIPIVRFQRCGSHLETAFEETETDYYFIVSYLCSADGKLKAFYINNRGYKSLDAKEIKIAVKNMEGDVLGSIFCGDGIIKPNTVFECNNTIDTNCKNITVSYSGYGIDKK